MFSKQQMRSILVGAIASIADWSVLVSLVQLLHLSPQKANIPSLIVGSLVQFLGNRNFVFKSTQRHYAKQMAEYVIVEGCAFFINASLFYALVTYTPTNYKLARPLCSLAVFLFFSYPMWKIVFRKKLGRDDTSSST